VGGLSKGRPVKGYWRGEDASGSDLEWRNKPKERAKKNAAIWGGRIWAGEK